MQQGLSQALPRHSKATPAAWQAECGPRAKATFHHHEARPDRETQENFSPKSAVCVLVTTKASGVLVW